MSWMSQLYKTYEENIGKSGLDEVVLTPLAHMNANVQIEVVLDLDGNFCGARKVDKQDAVTLIPVTESSAGRSSGIAPHILSDTLSYIAGDFCNYCKDEKIKKISEKKFDSYISQLRSWNESEYTHIKVNAIYKYLIKKTLVYDLNKSGIVTLDEDNCLDNKKIYGQLYEKAVVRFRVVNSENMQTDKRST